MQALFFLGQAFQFDSEIIIESGQFFNTAFNSTKFNEAVGITVITVKKCQITPKVHNKQNCLFEDQNRQGAPCVSRRRGR